MKTLFITAKIRGVPDYEKVKKLLNEKIPEKNIALCYSNQFVEIARNIEKITNKNVVSKTQVLGCSNPKFPRNTEAILIIGQAKFHSVSLAYESKLPTYILEDETIEKISEADVKKMEKKERAMYSKYLISKKIGVLVTNKPGQQRLKSALNYSQNLKGKKAYLFIANDLNISEFENFQIDCWVNTACPRMDLTDGNILNLEKLENLEKNN
ncbi:MAG: 2-(3-amino-3-carboxypropyl)histidine synthase subunit [Nanoarchaeota archaeon]|nr:2-(3-amino-3-carboxypropyl)histidine synthase subunit [Nanoarchaeota archaeon]